MITNQSGQVAIKWVLQRLPIPDIPVQDGDKKIVYRFGSQRNVHLIWVDKRHVNPILNIEMKTCNCNNGTKRKAYALASRMDVGIYENGDRHYLNPDYTETEN